MALAPKHTYEQLMEKIIRAKFVLQLRHVPHDDRCMLELDPDYYGECTCGAKAANAPNSELLDILEL